MAPERSLATPRIRSRLRRRPPASIRSARSILAAIQILVVGLAIILLVAGLVLKADAAWTILATISPSFVVAFAAYFAARGLRDRTMLSLGLTMAVGLVLMAGAIALLGVASSSSNGMDGNQAFGLGLVGLFLAALGVPLVWHVARGRAWFLERSTEGPAIVTAETILAESGGLAATAGLEIAPVAPIADGGAARTDEPLVSVRGLKKHFPILGGVLRRQVGTIYAVDGVDFDILRGEVFALVGESGCGKTTLGRTVLQLVSPTAGKVVFDGYELEDVDDDDMRPLRRRMQIIFQDPFGSLNPRMPVSDIIGEGLFAQGITDRRERDKRVEDALEIVGLRRDYTRRYPHEFSGGQRQRIGVARALALNPDFIVCDEPVSALDVSIQSQVLNLLLDLRRDFNLTYLFISHNLSVVEYFSDRVGVMYLGKLVEVATVEELYAGARHPYTVALLSAIPEPDPRRRRRRLVLTGDVPSPAAPPSGCRFHTRCWLREQLGNPEICSAEEPALSAVNGTAHQVACHFSDKVAGATAGAATTAFPDADSGGVATA